MSKTPVTQLNELRQGRVSYALVGQSGPPHQPVFVMSCTVDGVVYRGEGATKQLAKQAAAGSAVSGIMSSPAAAAAIAIAASSVDAAAPVAVKRRNSGDNNGGSGQPAAKLRKLQQPQAPGAAAPAAARPLPDSVELATKNPVSLLNELLNGSVLFSLAESKEIPGQTPRFVMQCVVSGIAYRAEASNKKVAKMRSAQIALRQIYGLMSTYAGSGDQTHSLGGRPTSTPTEQAFADAVQSLVRAKFYDLVAGLPERLARRKVLAGVVMSRGGRPELAHLDPEALLTVLCVTTGTKCLSGERLDASGECLLDCHAEILSRRCLLRVFQDQLAAAAAGAESIFYQPEPGTLFRLHPDVAFHLYISTSPCGDARVFAPTDEAAAAAPQDDEHPARASRGLLRTKIECGEGTIPVPAGLVAQTWDGILGGERLLTMSCSDKLAAWCRLGLQGCLLSCLTEPVPLCSLVIGSAFNQAHCRRALIGRLEAPPPGLPLVARPALLGVTERDQRQARSAPDTALNWCVLDGDDPASAELVNSSTGRLEDSGGGVSRIAKKSLYFGYASLLEYVNEQLPAGQKQQQQQQRRQKQRQQQSLSLPPVPAAGCITYQEAKAACSDYRSAKAAMVAFLRANGRGLWAAKPMELQDFTL